MVFNLEAQVWPTSCAGKVYGAMTGLSVSEANLGVNGLDGPGGTWPSSRPTGGTQPGLSRSDYRIDRAETHANGHSEPDSAEPSVRVRDNSMLNPTRSELALMFEGHPLEELGSLLVEHGQRGQFAPPAYRRPRSLNPHGLPRGKLPDSSVKVDLAYGSACPVGRQSVGQRSGHAVWEEIAGLRDSPGPGRSTVGRSRNSLEAKRSSKLRRCRFRRRCVPARLVCPPCRGPGCRLPPVSR